MESWHATLSQRCSRGMVLGEKLCERILETAAEMLNDRGFTTTASVADMKHNLALGVPTRFTKAQDSGGGTCLLFFDREERTGVKTVRTLMEQHADTHLVIIAIDGATPFTKREMSNVRHVSFFQAKELMHNITKNSLVPKHEAVPAEDVPHIKEKFCVLDEQWPAILSTDPVARWFAWPLGTIVRIHRTGLTQDTHVFYRKVAKEGS